MCIRDSVSNSRKLRFRVSETNQSSLTCPADTPTTKRVHQPLSDTDTSRKPNTVTMRNLSLIHIPDLAQSGFFPSFWSIERRAMRKHVCLDEEIKTKWYEIYCTQAETFLPGTNSKTHSEVKQVHKSRKRLSRKMTQSFVI